MAETAVKPAISRRLSAAPGAAKCAAVVIAALTIVVFGSISDLSDLTAFAKPNAVRGSAAAPPYQQPAGIVTFDFDADGKADIGRWHGISTELKVKKSNGGAYDTYTLGTGSARLAPADFNGDGDTDAAVFNAGTWTIKTSPGASA